MPGARRVLWFCTGAFPPQAPSCDMQYRGVPEALETRLWNEKHFFSREMQAMRIA